MKKTFKIKSLITALCAILVVVSLVFTLTACGDDKTDVPTTEPTSTEAPVSTTETVKPIEDEETETTSPSTTEEVVETEAPTQKPTEAPKPTPKPTEAPTKAPETTKKQEPKPTQAPTKAPETTKKPQSSSSSKDEPPTFADGTVDFGAVREEVEEEMGGIVYF